MTKAKIGLIGLVNDELKADFWGTARKLAEIGYKGIEGGGGALLQGDVKENLRRFHDLGLSVICNSAKKEDLRDNLDKIIADTTALEAPHVSVWWGPTKSKQEMLQDADLYNRAGAKLAAAGLKLCYHNHEHEFRTCFDGLYALDVLVANTDPKNLYFEIDVAWVTFGGEDPVRVIKRLASRIPAIHVKDLWSLEERGRFTAVGTGVVKTRESVEAAIAVGCEWVVIEQDKRRNLSAIETVTTSLLSLKEAGLV